MARTLILGGGFGGITVAGELEHRLGDDHEVLLVDASERFTMGLRKLWAMVGIGSLEEGSRSRRASSSRSAARSSASRRGAPSSAKAGSTPI